MRWYGCFFCLVAAATIIGLSGCGETSFSPQHGSMSMVRETPVEHSKSSATVGSSNPARLTIPAIGVQALVEALDVNANGDLATPTQHAWDGVGWYKVGPHPGEPGNAVMDGHLDQPGGYPAVFWKLHQLHMGNSVIVTDAQGKTLHFHVTRVVSYLSQQLPLSEIFGAANGSYLNLITCTGTWIPSQHQTTSRLVVYTSLG